MPEATAQAARAAGLLTPQALDRLLTDALKRQEAADSLLSIADRVAAAGIEPMSMEEINAEVKAARAERRRVRAVIDTNVLLAGLLWRGPPHALLEQVRAGTVSLVSSPALPAELADVIGPRSSTRS